MNGKGITIYEMLKFDEGIKQTLYKDTLGFYTIGIGHLVTKSANRIEALAILDKKFGRVTNGTLTTSEVETLFNEDVQGVINQIKQNSNVNAVYKSLDDIRKMALINMCFQLGVNGVASFSNSLQYLNSKQWEKAATNLKLSKWNSQTPNRSNRVIEVFRTGTLDTYRKFLP
ncbi:TPA: glycoside hydrolase family protein [Kluyvera ascorbata]